MLLDEQHVKDYFQPFFSRKKRTHIQLKEVKHLKTYNGPYVRRRYKAKKIIEAYPIGLLVPSYGQRVQLELHEPVYERAKALAPELAQVKNRQLIAEGWHYQPTYALREALGLRLMTFRKTVNGHSKVEQKWMQSFQLDFSRGDVIYARHNKQLIQVEEGLPCGYEDTELFPGMVRFSVFTSENGRSNWQRIARYSGTQIQFLMLLIFGDQHLQHFNSHDSLEEPCYG